MCGIFAILNAGNTESHYLINKDLIQKSFDKGSSRGPEYSILKEYHNLKFGFHRLAINGLNNNSNQPFEINDIILICNGEIYNFKKLAITNNINLHTKSDCEIIIHMYLKYGLEYTLSLLDGVFSFILYDKKKDLLHISRDPYGVRPLFYFIDKNVVCFASEIKVLYDLTVYKSKINHFQPGTYMTFNSISLNKKLDYYSKQYITFPVSNINYDDNIEILYKNVVDKLSDAIKKRVYGTCERQIGCLLSGGLDSSLVAALVNKHYTAFSSEKLETFSIGLEGSEDIKNAAIVAKHLDSKHHEIILTDDDFFNSIPEVIKHIESFDTTTIRASVGNYLLGKYIKNNTNCKVIFNGDGADELMGGYLYFKESPNFYEFDKECKRLLSEIYKFDVLRSDRCISSHGLEPRTPFLDKSFVEYYLTIDKKLRFDTNKYNCEKFIIRKSFDYILPDILPREILWRTKEAFSDGVSSYKKSWYEIINEKITSICKYDPKLNYEIISLINFYSKFTNIKNKPITYEHAYYRLLYNKYYNGTDNLIDYYWMPKFVSANDASARTLKLYSKNNSNSNNNNNNNNLY